MNFEDLDQTVDEVFDQVDQPRGQYPKLPKPVVGVIGSFAGCERTDSGIASVSTFDWADSEDATSYNIMGKGPGQGWSFEGTVPATQPSDGYVTVIGYDYVDWRVDACNTVGCTVGLTTWRQINQCKGGLRLTGANVK